MKHQTPNTRRQINTNFQTTKGCRDSWFFWSLEFRSFLVFGVCCLVFSTGCRPDMFHQPKSDPLKSSDFFADGGASRPLVSNTVARGHLELDQHFYTGKIGTNLVTTFPFPITRAILERGRERFEINCSPCHGRTGEGNGFVVQRGFPAPPSYHVDRLRDAPVGHFYEVITHGYGVMFSYAQHVKPEDRWAIAAYIRALQLSRSARPEDVPRDEQIKLEQTADRPRPPSSSSSSKNLFGKIENKNDGRGRILPENP